MQYEYTLALKIVSPRSLFAENSILKSWHHGYGIGSNTNVGQLSKVYNETNVTELIIE